MQIKNLHIDQLIERCKKADKSAQFEIYKRYYKAMYNTAYRILNNSFEAEDIMQESFLIAYNKLGTFKAEKKENYKNAPFGAWLKRIVINKSLTQLKKINKYENVPLERIAGPVTEEEGINDYSILKANALLDEIKKLNLYDFGIFIELSPDEEEKQLLENNIQMALQQQSIELEDAIDVREIRNLKLANALLKIRRKKKSNR